MHGARTFGKNNLIDPAINVIEMISISRHWDIPNSVIETSALWEYKKSANKLRNEAMAFKHVLTRLHGFFQSKVIHLLQYTMTMTSPTPDSSRLLSFSIAVGNV